MGVINPLVAAIMMPVSSLTVVLIAWRARTFEGAIPMSVIYIVLPLALLVVLAAVLAFVWAARSGQFDDTDHAGDPSAHRGRRAQAPALNRTSRRADARVSWASAAPNRHDGAIAPSRRSP